VAKAEGEEWAKRVQRWQDSGLTAREFAAEAGLKAASLTFWKWRLKKDQALEKEPPRLKPARRKSSESMRFVELSAAPVARVASLEFVVGPCSIRIPSGFDEVSLRRLLVILREQA
jgi:transposase